MSTTTDLLRDFFEQMEPEDIADWNRKQLLAWRERINTVPAPASKPPAPATKQVEIAKSTVKTLAAAKEALAESRQEMAKPRQSRKGMGRSTKTKRATNYIKGLKAVDAPRPNKHEIAQMFGLTTEYANTVVSSVYGKVETPYRAEGPKPTSLQRYEEIRKFLATQTERPTAKVLRDMFHVGNEIAGKLITEHFGKFTKEVGRTHGFRRAIVERIEAATKYVNELSSRPRPRAIAKQFGIGEGTAGQIIRDRFGHSTNKNLAVLKAFSEMKTRPSANEITSQFKLCRRYAQRLINKHFGSTRTAQVNP